MFTLSVPNMPDRKAQGSLQSRLREKISEAIACGDFEPGQTLPSTRIMAGQLDISRNTVTLVYEALAAEGVLVSAQRRGFYVAPDAVSRLPQSHAVSSRPMTVDWDSKLVINPAAMEHITHPRDWRSKKYTFMYGQHDRWIFPIDNWRKCSRDSLSLHDMYDWTVDYVDEDDPVLLDAFRRRVLPRRGFTASTQEVLVTVGAQHALYLAIQCLLRPGMVVGIEDPSYPDVRNLMLFHGAVLKPLPVDEDGVILCEAMKSCDIIYVTPSHQSPTTVTLSLSRRRQLLEMASAHDFIIIEDDYDTESRFGRFPSSALKSIDTEGRVVYVTSLSKLLSPGLRVGFLVGPLPFIRQARALRRMSIRHPAANNQRTVALFLKGGYYESLLKRFHDEYAGRWQTLQQALARYIPCANIASSEGGSSVWLKFPPSINTRELSQRAYRRDVYIQPGESYFLQDPQRTRPTHYMRLGFSSIKMEDIADGIAIVGAVVDEMLGEINAEPLFAEHDHAVGGSHG
ncbi:PLP-dependent aminotransferase family protein [Rouxiella chamberiensis]|uniref:PLP-dependent aminotransferase family protein n=1 Tax=Rouxiella chamberiensis TaxID=1513468 RepID=A0ABY7HSN8_9GAMM|nr:PLP-dependent aminotransferase family protein [Rouxiella chamberiensis]WAT02243.1 PLP-dependent aminotransferase family protein [Rouxiella chamberiensis]